MVAVWDFTNALEDDSHYFRSDLIANQSLDALQCHQQQVTTISDARCK